MHESLRLRCYARVTHDVSGTFPVFPQRKLGSRGCCGSASVLDGSRCPHQAPRVADSGLGEDPAIYVNGTRLDGPGSAAYIT